ncbi:S8 family serine peptidase [Legionella longbeachae]|uniref:Putative subtilisin-like serine protease n=1 Tax=Legionella longbeachae serogroup 1 (strain NSW150) TaxID=661367 RepID=D3HJM9_LEGLN|nr:S8 family serine peptidase [Legionella longbeachae]VEE03158.1 subtilisin-like serine protease [Legionella oakridgensis]HBD7398961.1 S8 family serine peptidase [Legionella pneumophila]ARB93942.1 protease [Legionella longbeachae]ARM32920.1 S8 family serine peptidase [Legionella longbeachae]EEZ94264.1 putative protease [Legionella longbeachae D-4968]
MRYIFRRFCVTIFLLAVNPILFAKAIIDIDVLNTVKHLKNSKRLEVNHVPLSLLIFLHNFSEKESFIDQIKKIRGVRVQDLGFMPAVAIQLPKNSMLLNQIANFDAVAQISLHRAAETELDTTTQALKLAPSSVYPNVDNWWAHGYTGQKGIIGIIDTGVDPLHPALSNKRLIVRQDVGSGYSNHINGVKEPHATGIACIYTSVNEKYKGIAYGASTIISGLAGEETADPASILLTMETLDWMLDRSEVKPALINYSMGNGKLDLDCPFCPEWSGLAKVIDYVVNTKKILWVKSAGNAGYIEATEQFPYASTLTVPGDNYNGLTIANMNMLVVENDIVIKTPDRRRHIIRNTSSRGPTPFGRRKPDLTAPGHDTMTCAPDPKVYGFIYSNAMNYKDGYRLMGGTSSAAPHVGASALLLQDAGIQNPMAIKALLINSADTWTDAGTADSKHSKIMGSAWNRTYGWGYLNMEKAFQQRNNIVEDELTVANPVWEYRTVLKKGQKITLVHERRVGYTPEGAEWQLSHLELTVFDLKNQKLIDKDSSPVDTVHQVANCKRELYDSKCSEDSRTTEVLIRVQLLSKTIEGSSSEPFAIVVPQVASKTSTL